MKPSSAILTINADDFGLSVPVNKAIDYCFNHHLINSTSMMVNTPAFEQACTMGHAAWYKKLIGLHVNLTEGRPVSDFRLREYLNEEGNWNRSKITAFRLKEKTMVKEAFRTEILAQLKKFEDAGFEPSHIDSHHHTHTLPWLFPVFLQICTEKNYPLRLAQTNSSGSIIKGTYRNLINAVLKKRKLNFTDYFESLGSYETRKAKMSGYKVEIMVHPSFNDAGLLIDTLDNLKFEHNHKI
jgi:chitin disaccharide deacetylase